MDRHTLRIELVYTDGQEREFHVGRTFPFSEDQLEEWYESDDVGSEFVEIKNAIDDADRLAAEALGIGPDPEIVRLSHDDRTEVADNLLLLAEIDGGENLDSDRLRALADLVRKER